MLTTVRQRFVGDPEEDRAAVARDLEPEVVTHVERRARLQSLELVGDRGPDSLLVEARRASGASAIARARGRSRPAPPARGGRADPGRTGGAAGGRCTRRAPSSPRPTHGAPPMRER